MCIRDRLSTVYTLPPDDAGSSLAQICTDVYKRQTLLKLERWLPTEFLLQLSRVNRITHIVTLSVCYITNQIQVSTLRATEQPINGLDNHLDDIDILPLVETADVIGLEMCIRDSRRYGRGSLQAFLYSCQQMLFFLRFHVCLNWMENC